MKSRFLFSLLGLGLSAHAQSSDPVLPELKVYSPRVANQSPTATFAMPVSALRFEPRVDLQSRNFSEGQADVTIRGGIFENTGFSVGAVSLFDPQTGHYFAEIPIAPAMLGAPEIVTGADLGSRSTNATSGAVAYAWRPIRTGGSASVGLGEFGLFQSEFYHGYTFGAGDSPRTVAADIAFAHSDSNGTIPFGDHDFNRINARIQSRGDGTQTDLFAGYQDKFFGWPNLYTPFNSNETEDLQTLLIVFNHRREQGAGDFIEWGGYYRRNDDDYAFNRFAPVGPVHPFQHTTSVKAAAVGGRITAADTSYHFRAEILADELDSTSLNYGRYRSRTIAKVSLAPERAWSLPDGARLRIKAGAAFDETNRGSGKLSPLFEIAREKRDSLTERIYFSYAQATQLPTYTALNSNAAAGLFRGNPHLGRQVSRNAEMGVSGRWGEWTGQAALFHRWDEDLVDWTFRRGVTARSANPVDVATSGFEMIARRSWEICDLVLGYTALSKDPDYKGAPVDASFYALNYARHRVTAALVARLTSRLELRVDNQLRRQAANFLRSTGGSDAIITSVGLSYRPVALRHLVLTAQVDNMWDSDFQEVPAVPAGRRQISGTVRYSW